MGLYKLLEIGGLEDTAAKLILILCIAGGILLFLLNVFFGDISDAIIILVLILGGVFLLRKAIAS